MKHLQKHRVLIAASLLFSAMAQAFPDPDQADPNDLNPTDAPIDGWIIWLGILGMCYIYAAVRKAVRSGA